MGKVLRIIFDMLMFLIVFLTPEFLIRLLRLDSSVKTLYLNFIDEKDKNKAIEDWNREVGI